jgi:hypothetical protein
VRVSSNNVWVQSGARVLSIDIAFWPPSYTIKEDKGKTRETEGFRLILASLAEDMKQQAERKSAKDKVKWPRSHCADSRLYKCLAVAPSLQLTRTQLQTAFRTIIRPPFHPVLTTPLPTAGGRHDGRAAH